MTAAVLIVALGSLMAGDTAPGSGDALADRVLGQPDFLHNAANSAKANSVNAPSAVAVDSRGHLYVADSQNSRVLGWRSFASLTNGAPADLLIGQPDFVSGGCNHGVANGDRSGVGPDSLCLLSANGNYDEFGGLAVDAQGNLFVADPANSRVLQYDSPFDNCTSFPCLGTAANRVIGQPDFTSAACNLGLNHASSSTLCGPNSVAVDALGNLYVADTGNSRILEYNTPLDPFSGETAAGDFIADMVFGQGDFYAGGSQCFIGPLCTVLGVAVDAKGNLWAANSGFNQILEFNTPLDPSSGALGAGDAIPDATLGGSDCPYAGQVPRASGTCEPSAVALDKAGNLFVADWGDSRVVEFNTPLDPASGEPGAGDVSADMVFGQAGFTRGLCNRDSSPAYSTNAEGSTLCWPYGLALDASGNLYVADQNNNRVTIYRSPLKVHGGEPGTGDAVADVVLGQRDFFHHGANLPDAGSLFGPLGNALDSAGHLWVADTGNGRVLGWCSAVSFANGAPADLVIGKPDFNTVGCQHSGYLCNPMSVAADHAGNLYVADSVFNNRVLEYNSPFAACSKFPCVGPAPNLVFGQARIDMQGCNRGDLSHANALTLCGPQGIAVDTLGNLYIADSNNHRVLEYNTPLDPHSGEPGAGDTVADVVFGQTDFTSRECWWPTRSAATLCYPSAVAVDSFNNVYVIDNGIRVFEYNTPLNPWSGEPGAGDTTADFVLGQPDFTSANASCSRSGGPPDASTYCSASGIAIDARGDVYVSDIYDNRILEYSAPLGSHLTADRIFGQYSFFVSNCNAGTAPGDLAGIGPDSLCYFGIVPELELGPAGLAVDPNLNVYASDISNSRVLVYNNPLGAPIPGPTPSSGASPIATPTITTSPTPTPTATPIPGHPFISNISNPVLAGAGFLITGAGFTHGSVVNFFVSTASGSVNTGPLTPATWTSASLNVEVPSDNILGQGFVAVQVVNSDRGYAASNLAAALLEGSAVAGIPSITSINGTTLAPTSANPRFAADNTETVVTPGNVLSLGGSGFDVTNGVAVDLFCACAGGKVGPFILSPGNPGLHSTLIQFTLPPTGPDAAPVGPAALVVSNKGTAGSYAKKSNAVSVPIGAQISVTSVVEGPAPVDIRGPTITVNGTGFSPLTVINFFNTQSHGVVNLGGLNSDGTPKIPLTIVNDKQFTFVISSAVAVPGPSYVQALNPPFVPFTSSGNDPGGAFTLK